MNTPAPLKRAREVHARSTVIAGAITLVILTPPECRLASFLFASPMMGFGNHGLFAVLPPVGAKIISASTAESTSLGFRVVATPATLILEWQPKVKYIS
jgi:hypothetical protein